MESFKAKYCGAEYHNIDGTGWPDAVVMENDGSVLEGTYELRTYYPERTYHGIFRGTPPSGTYAQTARMSGERVCAASSRRRNR